MSIEEKYSIWDGLKLEAIKYPASVSNLIQVEGVLGEIEG